VYFKRAAVMQPLNASQCAGYELQLAHFAAEMISLPKAGGNSHDLQSRLGASCNACKQNGV
jgi:hypothetical protein